ncbi:putative nucleotidyltransferase [Abeliophyllum distichum]|uniref:Nucleotidyltransferase n=1 Tax=Abeliophyllum distichum TaxID=126358 RepID=A0ABD1PEA2_9LAMI
MAALSGNDVTTTTTNRIQKLLEKGTTTHYLVDLINQEKTRQFWLDDGLLKTKENLSLCAKRWRFEKILNHRNAMTHFGQGIRKRNALLHCCKRENYCPQMRNDIATYVKTYLVCQHNKKDH